MSDISFLRQTIKKRFPAIVPLAKLLRSAVKIPRNRPTQQGMREIFREIYLDNRWLSNESASGIGSQLDQTAGLRRDLPKLIEDFQIRSMLDIPCGDFHWMQHVELPLNYIGADVVPDLIHTNQEKHRRPGRDFRNLDLTKDRLPNVDLVFCRDVLVHFSFADALRALLNARNSGSKYILTTTFPGRPANIDIPTGHWRPLNLEKPPFCLPAPTVLINEGCTEDNGNWTDKSMGLWTISELRAARVE